MQSFIVMQRLLYSVKFIYLFIEQLIFVSQ